MGTERNVALFASEPVAQPPHLSTALRDMGEEAFAVAEFDDALAGLGFAALQIGELHGEALQPAQTVGIVDGPVFLPTDSQPGREIQ
jgi:hypothetical protein